MKRGLCIWLPGWPIQRLAVARPELRERPVILHETRRGVQRVVACSARAKALGAAEGMSLAEVAAKPQAAIVLILPYDPLADREALEALAEHCGRFSPIVAVEPSPVPDGLLLDITGLVHLFGGETALAEKIAHDFTRRGLIVRMAIADTLAAAWAVAHFGQGGNQASPGSSFILHPSSFFLVPPGETLPALRPLPVEALRLPEEVVGWLHQLGIRRIGQLEALPRGELSSRFGPELLRRWDQAIGWLAEPVPAHQPAPEFEADWSPESPTARRETLEAALEQLITRVAAMLVRLGRGAMRLECRLGCISATAKQLDPVQVSIGLFEPTASAGHLFQLAQMQLERLRLPAPVAAVHVAATATAPLVQRQQEMFFHGDGSQRASARQLAALVDRLNSRLGYRSVVRARLVSDAQPELAWCYDPLVGNSRRRMSAKQIAAELPPRPLRLLSRPIALVATSVVPEGPPLRFHLAHREHQIAHTWGPERIETGWWRGRTVGRDYYRIETTAGRRFWLFRRLRDGRWFIHGMFQ